MNSIVLPVSSWSRIDLVLHVAPDQRVERAERLVVEHQLRGRPRTRARGRRAAACRRRAGPGTGSPTSSSPTRSSTSAARASRSCLRHALDLEPERHVVDDPAVREQAEVLEDHRDGVAAQLAQLPASAASITSAAADGDLAGGRLDQPDQRPDERGLARPGQAHDHEHLAGLDLERDVADRDDAARLLPQLRPRELGVRRADDLVGARSEDLPHALRAEQRLAVAFRGGGRRFRGLNGCRAARVTHCGAMIYQAVMALASQC